MTKKLLIYIPTYNRISKLEGQLNRLIKQVENSDYDLSIIVSNNCSTEGDYRNLEEKYRKFPVSFKTNTGNIGGNGNIFLGFIYATGFDYLWILSDDDPVSDDCLKHIYPELDKAHNLIHIGDYDVVHTRTAKCDPSFFTCTEGAGFGLISKVIYKTDFFSEYFVNGLEHYETSFPHMSITLSKVKSEGQVEFRCLLNKYIFTADNNREAGTADYASSYMGFIYVYDFMPVGERKKMVLGFLKENYQTIYGFRKKSEAHAYKYRKMFGYILFVYPSAFISFYLWVYRDKIINLIKYKVLGRRN